MSNIKGIIVDDEARSRRVLRALCEEYCENLSILGVAASVKEAKLLIEIEQPDIVFLDIRMPLESGFELIKSYGENIPFDVIFTTAYEEHALEALKFSAIDYLLKPIEIDQLIKAVERVRQTRNICNYAEKFEFLSKILSSDNNEKVALTTADGLTFVNYKNIIRCEAESNYTQIVIIDESPILITRTLKYFDDMLSEKGFFRIHKSHLVNLYCIRKFTRSKNGGLVETIDGVQMEVSGRKRDALLERLSQL